MALSRQFIPRFVFRQGYTRGRRRAGRRLEASTREQRVQAQIETRGCPLGDLGLRPDPEAHEVVRVKSRPYPPVLPQAPRIAFPAVAFED